ncbi:ABC transporter substrate-binding protein [Paenibacillus ginsengarvi]|uniref:Extracellular solute-binding protein n=1 Tax=Paenibacillus ginsengarvi TaxID=400777 RepID=A0A3B0CJ40_9BACL|nr:extracellular solute-binding protein [Paenibacillus ginsengarvi]RKN84594.1 extracellular solute-binding protein [Paenibacillus ginsengarvi]
MKKTTICAAAAGLLLFLNGCGGQESGGKDQGGVNSEAVQISSDPVTLKFMVSYGAFNDENFQAYFVDQLAKKYPNITVERVGGKLEDLIAAGETPDLLMSGLPGIPALQDLKVIEDLGPYIKKFKTDLSKYNPDAIGAIKTFSDKEDMLALPFRMNVPALFYNKDVFDTFGIPYPQDGMTWEEATVLAGKLTRKESNVQYYGLLVGGADRMAMGLVLPYVNKQTNEAALGTDGWQRLFNQYKAIYSLPGYITDGKVPTTVDKFIKQQTNGMAAYWSADMFGELKKMATNGQTFNWDMATVPTFDKGKGYAWQVESQNFLISSASKHKEQAFQVISYLVGEEVQKLQNKGGEVPVLRESEGIRKDFGTDLSFLKGKHTDALFMLPQGLHQHTKYDQKARSIINAAAEETATKGVDVNTSLRNAQEKLNQYIKDQIGG